VKWGDAGYAREELVAELGSAFLCADLGITPKIRDDHAAYLASWLTVLKNDTRLIVSAASHAQRAADYLQSLQPRPADTIETEVGTVASVHVAELAVPAARRCPVR
jgi:antirestriction protein ArdC